MVFTRRHIENLTRKELIEELLQISDIGCQLKALNYRFDTLAAKHEELKSDLLIKKNRNTLLHTARKSIFPRSWNIIESSKRPRKHHLSINFLADEKTVFSITKKFKARTFK